MRRLWAGVGTGRAQLTVPNVVPGSAGYSRWVSIGWPDVAAQAAAVSISHTLFPLARPGCHALYVCTTLALGSCDSLSQSKGTMCVCPVPGSQASQALVSVPTLGASGGSHLVATAQPQLGGGPSNVGRRPKSQEVSPGGIQVHADVSL